MKTNRDGQRETGRSWMRALIAGPVPSSFHYLGWFLLVIVALIVACFLRR